MTKCTEGTLEDRIEKVITGYNKTYHSAILNTSAEAIEDNTGTIMLRNSPDGDYAGRYKKRWRDKFEEGQRVRIANRENIREDAKYTKGRFIKTGTILRIMEGDSYLVKYDSGDRIVKKRHYDLKGMTDKPLMERMEKILEDNIVE